MTKNGLLYSVAAVISTLTVWTAALAAEEGIPDLAVIRRGEKTGFVNAGWKYDRYKNLKGLDAGKRMVVADLKGPGVITHIHMCRHHPEDLCSRGIVLEITFDDAEAPAVHCPVADFFGDGCNGSAMDFSSRFIEAAPWSYNCYFPMPFKTRAKVVLRNDTNKNVMDYSYVEWKPLKKWQENLGYFHATYRRDVFQLTPKTDHMFFHVKGDGHVLGRQYSVITSEPVFKNFAYVMEGNNEVDIDGRERALDYLGTEDSFTFSWGFQRTFAGLRTGMTVVDKAQPNRLSIFRFHDHQPIRFEKELRWHINWSQEQMFTRRPQWRQALARGGCWVDYATVYYWYQDSPGDFQHAKLRDLSQRSKALLQSSVDRVTPKDLKLTLDKLKTDSEPANTFSGKNDLKRVAIRGCWRGTHPFWIDRPKARGGHPGNPNPGRSGILAVHAAGPGMPAYVMRKVALPAGKPSKLRIVASGDPYELPGKSDFVLRAGVYDGKELRWMKPHVIEAGKPPSKENWQVLEFPLEGLAGKTVGLVVEVSYGGPKSPAMNEEAFFDEISVVTD